MTTWAVLKAIGFGVGITSAALASSGCAREPPPKPVSNWTVEDARAFNGFSLYWLGQSYKGLDLTLINTDRDSDGVRHVEFSYGQLSYYGDAASGSWHSPLEADIQPYCGYSPEEVQSQPRYLDPEIATIQVRGVDAYVERYDHDWNYLTLWSGNSAIHISAHKTGFDIEQAARDLIPIVEEAGATLEPLPPPTSTEC